MRRIIVDGRPAFDHWTLVEDPDVDPSALTGDVIVPLRLWQAHREALQGRSRLGVWLDAAEAVEDLAGDLEAFELIALAFPVFTDGRGLSSAVLLRTRLGWRGELRAIGDVVVDHLDCMRRCGINAFVLREDIDPAAALSSMRGFSAPYQGCAIDPRPLWRREDRSHQADERLLETG